MITDVDKKSYDRRKPTPNTHDVLIDSSVSSKGTNSLNYVTPSTNISQILAAKSGQFNIVSSQDVTLTLQNVSLVGSLSGFGAGTYLLYQVPHNLSYIPGVVGYWFDATHKYYSLMPYKTQGISSNAGFMLNFWMTADTTYIYIYVDYMTFSEELNPTGNYQFRYYLLQQTPN